jgi:phytoene dehydrogenase-like protein
MSETATPSTPVAAKAKGGRPSEYAGKSIAVVATKEVIKGYKSKSPGVTAAIKTILATKNSTKVATAIKGGTSVAEALVADVKKAPKVEVLLGVDVDFLEKDGKAEQVKISTAHIRRAIAENLIVVA